MRTRTWTWTKMLAVAVLAAPTALGYAPTTAQAEGFGGPCSSISPGAILPLPVHFNATTGAPFTPSMVEFTDDEPLPLSDFTATAEWGDGSTSPATISAESCHKVTASSHAYAHSGAYPFFYNIHDAHTGLDHVIGAETIYIWGLPQRVDDSSSRAIHATVGVPWSGVLGEFTEESLPFTGASYFVHVEWEAGDRVWAPATITTSANGTLVVTGSHVYSTEFNGTATVEVGIVEAISKWPVSASVRPLAAPTTMFKLVDQPILAAIPSVKKSTAYELIFRLSQPLPRTKSGRILASLSGYGVAGSLASFGPHESHTCYAAGITPPKGRAPKPHRRYPFTLGIQTAAGAKISGHSALRHYFNFASMLTGASKKLGC